MKICERILPCYFLFFFFKKIMDKHHHNLYHASTSLAVLHDYDVIKLFCIYTRKERRMSRRKGTWKLGKGWAKFFVLFIVLVKFSLYIFFHSFLKKVISDWMWWRWRWPRVKVILAGNLSPDKWTKTIQIMIENCYDNHKIRKLLKFIDVIFPLKQEIEYKLVGGPFKYIFFHVLIKYDNWKYGCCRDSWGEIIESNIIMR